MVTEVDLTALKQKVVDIIKGDDTLFEESNTTGNKFRSVDIGIPTEKNYLSIPTPYCRVTNDTELEMDVPHGGNVSNVTSASFHKIKLKIIVFHQEKDTKTVETTLDTIHKKLKERLKADNSLGGLVKISHPIRTEQLAGGLFKGKAVDGFAITLQCELVTN